MLFNKTEQYNIKIFNKIIFESVLCNKNCLNKSSIQL